MQLLKELERFTSCNTSESKRDWADKWAPKIIEQARLETTTCSAASISCAQVIALGKRLYSNTLITLEAQGSNWKHQSYYCSLAKEHPWAGAPYKSAKEGDGQSFKCFHMCIATKEHLCHVSSDSTPSNTNSKVQQSQWWFQR